MRSSCELSSTHPTPCRPCQRPCPTQKKVADGRQICSLSALPLGKCDLFPFLPLLIIKRLSAPRFMNAAIMDNDNIVPLALFEVKLKSAIIPIGVIHHEEGTELVPLRQTKKVVPDNGTDGVNFTMLSIKIMAKDVFLCLLVKIRIRPFPPGS